VIYYALVVKNGGRREFEVFEGSNVSVLAYAEMTATVENVDGWSRCTFAARTDTFEFRLLISLCVTLPQQTTKSKPTITEPK
jgi:hypothetical protein